LAFDVWPTPLAAKDLASLRGQALMAAKRARSELQANGCRAAHYRLEGAGLDRICCRHLHGAWRMIVAFPAVDQVCVLLVGEHNPRASSNVYGRLYQGLGIGPPVGERDKPPCCPDANKPPVDEELVERFLELGRRLQSERRRLR